MEEMFEAKYLNPSSIRLSKSKNGVLEGYVEGKRYAHLSLSRAFPLSLPRQYLAILSHEDKEPQEVGMIRDLDHLDHQSKSAAEQELQLRYVVPTITSIQSIKQEPAFWRWTIETDRGPAELIMRNIHEHVRVMGSSRLILTGVDGRRFELADASTLDGHSKYLLRRYL